MSDGGSDTRQFRSTLPIVNKTAPIHRWVDWIAGFSSDCAGQVIDDFIVSPRQHRKALILDPFAGVATTLVEAQRRGIRSVGFEINPFAALVAQAKLTATYVNHIAFVRQIERY